MYYSTDILRSSFINTFSSAGNEILIRLLMPTASDSQKEFSTNMKNFMLIGDNNLMTTDDIGSSSIYLYTYG